MRLLIRIHRADIGGSQRSLLQIATRLAERKVEVEFAGEEGDWVRDGRFGSFRFHKVPYRPFRLRGIESALRTAHLLRRGQFDLVLANGAYLAWETAFPAAAAGIPVVVLLPGGRLPRLPIWHRQFIVCFSHELLAALRNRGTHQECDLFLARNRVDTKMVRADGRRSSGFDDLLDCDDRSFVLVMLSRLDNGKMGAVENVLEATRILRQRRDDFRLILVGGGAFLEEIRDRSRRMNEERSRPFLFLTGKVDRPVPILRRADVILGAGLSVLEGLLFGRPGLIVGEKGFAGAIQSDSIADLEFYNFSGRNLDSPVNPERLADVLDRLLSDSRLREEWGVFGMGYVETHLDLDLAIPDYIAFFHKAIRSYQSRRADAVRALGFLCISGCSTWRKRIQVDRPFTDNRSPGNAGAP